MAPIERWRLTTPELSRGACTEHSCTLEELHAAVLAEYPEDLDMAPARPTNPNFPKWKNQLSALFTSTAYTWLVKEGRGDEAVCKLLPDKWPDLDMYISR